MTFLYSSLSILFLSGILLISKHATLFSNRNPVGYLDNDYLTSKFQIIDKYFLSVLKNNEINYQGNELCYSLKQKLASSGYIEESDLEYFVYNQTSSSHPLLIDSCILSNGYHRILVKSNPSKEIKYNFNSCLVRKKNTCSFEEN